ncbi:MAG: phosphoadenosine phosphosulfate reductase family protein [Methanospirillum sp.]|nr:phosphoadenosine phosphosulfate reductase family protein [Methanospirillum sp.]
MPVKKTLYWCHECNVPLLGKRCGAGHEGQPIALLEPYDVRPALAFDHDLIARLVRERFGPVPVPRVLLLNKAGGTDRDEFLIANGARFGRLSFDPVTRRHRFDLEPDALPSVIGHATRGVVDLDRDPAFAGAKVRLGGKRVPVTSSEPDGSVIVRYRGRCGTGVLAGGWLRVRELVPVEPAQFPDPGPEEVVACNRGHLRNIERQAVRRIRVHLGDRPCANVSFSGGKDSTVVLELAKRAGVTEAFFIDTGLEFPETVSFARSLGVRVVEAGVDFDRMVEEAGLPTKDDRWCCEILKLRPLRRHLAGVGACVTLQGNRWYESWGRSSIGEVSRDSANPLQLIVSPIRNWRALEVWLYIWWRDLPYNPLYDQGLERLGCYLCPSMLESEFDRVRSLYPGPASRWESVLRRWADERGLPPEFVLWGLWRWKVLPAKMVALCRRQGIPVPEGKPLAPAPGSFSDSPGRKAGR